MHSLEEKSRLSRKITGGGDMLRGNFLLRLSLSSTLTINAPFAGNFESATLKEFFLGKFSGKGERSHYSSLLLTHYYPHYV